MDLFPDEQEIEESKNEGVILTTHRIRSTNKSGDYTHMTSIMLDELCSCECSYNSNWVPLVLGVLVFVGSLVAGIQINAWAYTGIVMAVILLGSYWTGRGGFMIFSSAGGRIITRKTRIKIDRMLAFIDRVESAKNNRYLRMSEAPVDDVTAGYRTMP